MLSNAYGIQKSILASPKAHFSVFTDQFWTNTPLQLTLETFVRWFRFPVNIVFGSSDRKMQSSRLTKALWTESCRGAKATKSRIFGNCHDNFLDFCPFRDYCVEKSKKSCSCVRTSVHPYIRTYVRHEIGTSGVSGPLFEPLAKVC